MTGGRAGHGMADDRNGGVRFQFHRRGNRDDPCQRIASCAPQGTMTGSAELLGPRPAVPPWATAARFRHLPPCRRVRAGDRIIARVPEVHFCTFRREPMPDLRVL